MEGKRVRCEMKQKWQKIENAYDILELTTRFTKTTAIGIISSDIKLSRVIALFANRESTIHRPVRSSPNGKYLFSLTRVSNESTALASKNAIKLDLHNVSLGKVCTRVDVIQTLPSDPRRR